MNDFYNQSNTLSVSELVKSVKATVESGFPSVWVKGEISNFVLAASGHSYFTLKDKTSQVRCAFFRSRASGIDFKFENGQEIEVLASPTIFEKRGEFQLIVMTARRSGVGELFEIFEARKKKFTEEGFFDDAFKSDIPLFPRRIGIVTSKDAAALKDVLTTLETRAPNVDVVIYPSPVQGEGAGRQLAASVSLANSRREVDTLIVCRGGGSFEDLFEFNSEELVRAVHSSDIPVISGVGHETDFTLVDFVADMRAPTPTAAAVASVYSRREVQGKLETMRASSSRKLEARLNTLQQRLDYAQRRIVHPEKHNRDQINRLAELKSKLQRVFERLLVHRSRELQKGVLLLRNSLLDTDVLEKHVNVQRTVLKRQMVHRFQRFNARVSGLKLNLTHLDPQQVLSRGYSIVRDASGHLVIDSASVSKGADLTVTLKKGELTTKVTSTNPKLS